MLTFILSLNKYMDYTMPSFFIFIDKNMSY